jgi:intracellular multiplication protein IcmL
VRRLVFNQRDINVTEEKLQIIRLRNDFYRDGFRKILLSFGIVSIAIVATIVAIIYLLLSKPAPIVFNTYDNFRVVPAVPVNQVYISDADLRQWVSNVLQSVFVFDFYHYSDQFKSYRQYFTDTGWKIYSDFLNNFVVQDRVIEAKAFVHSAAENAPQILEKGPLPDGRFAWWVQMKLKINYTSPNKNFPNLNPVIRVLVVRVPTIHNLTGVAIENIMLGNIPNTTQNSGRLP